AARLSPCPCLRDQKANHRSQRHSATKHRARTPSIRPHSTQLPTPRASARWATEATQKTRPCAHRLPDPELECRRVLAPELRVGGAQREAPATNVATM